MGAPAVPGLKDTVSSYTRYVCRLGRWPCFRLERWLGVWPMFEEGVRE